MRLIVALPAAACLTLAWVDSAAFSDTVNGAGGVIPASGTGGGGAWVAGASATILPSAPASFGVLVPVAVNGVTSITLTNLQHTWVGDCHAVLLAPDGAMYNLFVRPALFNPNDGHPGNFSGTYTFVASGAVNSLPTDATGASSATNLVRGTYNQTFGGSAAAGATWVNGNLGIYNRALSSIKGPAGVWRLRFYDWVASDSGSLGSWTLNYTPALEPLPQVPAIIGGGILISSFASSPIAPPNSGTSNGQVSPLNASGSGGTSSGLVGGSGQMNAIIAAGGVTTLHITGSASVSQPAGHGGSGSVGIYCYTPEFMQAPLILSIQRLSSFSIDNQNAGATVSFAADTGQIVGSRLLPGNYLIDVNCFANISGAQTFASQTMNWLLTIAPVVAPCAGDVNENAVVNTDDLLLVVGAWGACPQPAYCRADRHIDGQVNTDDLLAVITTWGACP